MPESAVAERAPVVEAPAPRRPRALDPRTGLVLLVVGSVLVMSADGLRFVPAVLLLAVGLGVWEGALRRTAALIATVGVIGVLGGVVPALWPGAATATLALACSYGIRFLSIAAIGAHLVSTTSPTRLAAALRAWRTPRAVAVPLAVMLRFTPVVASEARAVHDALRLRGLAGATGFVRHPLRATERFVVPMIAVSLRASEDLAASAVLRGMGSAQTPTAMHPPRFAAADLVAAMAAAALVVGALVVGAGA